MRMGKRSWFGAAMALSVGTAVACAVPLPEPGFVDTYPGWDYRDPVNIAEARVYARLWFEFKDTGVVSPEFQAFRFTNPAPRSPMTPFYGAEKLFKHLYAHRLIPWEDGTPWKYGLDELMRDDPAVNAAFRLYATTGTFESLADGNVELPVERLMAAEDDLFTRLVHIVGYDGLKLAGRVRDLSRLAEAFKEVESPGDWPTRDAYEPKSLDKFPHSVGIGRQGAQAVPVYAIVDPVEIDAAWTSLFKAKEVPPDLAKGEGKTGEHVWPREKYPTLDGPKSGCVVAHIEPTNFQSRHTVPFTWPTWADAKLTEKNRGSTYPGLAKYRWTALVATRLGYRSSLGPTLATLGVNIVSDFTIFGVSASSWRVVAREQPIDIYQKQWPRGVLVFPLWESPGLVRDAASDPWTNERNGPMSAHVESPDFEWKVRGRNSLVLPAPSSEDGVRGIAAREYVVLPETLAKQPVPIISVYKAKTWKPFAEDFVFRIGPPTTAEGLRAVCVFMTCTDETLKSMADAMKALAAKPAEPPVPAQPPAGKP